MRIIDNTLHINAKAEKVFTDRNDAKYLIDTFNALKLEHLGISRKTTAIKYLNKFNGLLAQGHEVQYIKDVLGYLFETWKEDSFWINYLNVETICRHFDKYADQYELSMQNTSQVNDML